MRRHRYRLRCGRLRRRPTAEFVVVVGKSKEKVFLPSVLVVSSGGRVRVCLPRFVQPQENATVLLRAQENPEPHRRANARREDLVHGGRGVRVEACGEGGGGVGVVGVDVSRHEEERRCPSAHSTGACVRVHVRDTTRDPPPARVGLRERTHLRIQRQRRGRGLPRGVIIG